ncbi:MAG TPA: helix-turn-helix transcriptional regulator [Burkholderiaceae bacterium]
MVKHAKPVDPKRLFGRRLAELRKERGWSQEQLALESGLARSYLGGVERGQRNIALLNICKLADTLQVPLPYLMDFLDGS